ncbi:uncharacterized protein TNCV_1648011 [Trichonephila clavipes]|uniref:Uncharacterized protein n=1 Tax=Trichonephila clavipes TaxID=2585209 RepID=A0A8X6UXQ0_TRICX|nr:uncharacterized protein TNCV_1648011 [Trichonephila clavipes]
MIACFAEENHDNWNRFLHEFSFKLHTAVNETPAELFLGRKIVTPFRKLVRVTDGAEYVGSNIEKLFDEARQNMQIQHKRNIIIEGLYRVLEVKNNNLTIWKRGRKVTVNVDQVELGTIQTLDKGNAGLEDLRVKRSNVVESTGTSERSRFKEPEGLPKEQRSMGIDNLQQNSLSMEAVDGDPADKST